MKNPPNRIEGINKEILVSKVFKKDFLLILNYLLALGRAYKRYRFFLLNDFLQQQW
jgi:hypothetical protein